MNHRTRRKVRPGTARSAGAVPDKRPGEPQAVPGMDASHGRFSGEPVTRWHTEVGAGDRAMEVVEDFFFTDPGGRRWPAPAGSLVNGASIPRALWTTVGAPYVGDYRRASIVHDVACAEAGRNSERRRDADRMFFHACRAGGCSRQQATVLYLGVRVGALAPEVSGRTDATATPTHAKGLRRSPDELAFERDFARLAAEVLPAADTDDPIVVERRTDAVLAKRPRRPKRSTGLQGPRYSRGSRESERSRDSR